MGLEKLWRKFDEFDALLAKTKPENLRLSIMLTLLRPSYAVRSLLPHWTEFLDASVAEARRRGEPADTIFKGLI